MDIFLYALIAIFGVASYIVGIWQMLKNKYSPSTFSRAIWVLLAINSFAGVVLSNGSKSSILLGAIFLLGNAGMFFVSLWKGVRGIGRLEYYCLLFLLMSGLVWAFFDAALINLAIGLLAHFVAGAPTYKKVWFDPKSESIGFWALFFIASLLSLFIADTTSLKSIVFPIYFAIFDGSMSLLVLRKFRRRS